LTPIVDAKVGSVMAQDALNWKYSDCDELVKKGDSVIVDDRSGVVEEVCIAGSQLAENYYCEDTGGLLIKFEDGLLELLPFGYYHRITKSLAPPKAPD
jgi:hypothetical protein